MAYETSGFPADMKGVLGKGPDFAASLGSAVKSRQFLIIDALAMPGLKIFDKARRRSSTIEVVN